MVAPVADHVETSTITGIFGHGWLVPVNTAITDRGAPSRQ
jgi:hypothetical protein